MKKAIFVILLVALLIASGKFYFWHKSITATKDDAMALVEEFSAFKSSHDELVSLKEKLRKEKERCDAFIAQREGSFDEFDYCRRYLELVSEYAL